MTRARLAYPRDKTKLAYPLKEVKYHASGLLILKRFARHDVDGNVLYLIQAVSYNYEAGSWDWRIDPRVYGGENMNGPYYRETSKNAAIKLADLSIGKYGYIIVSERQLVML